MSGFYYGYVLSSKGTVSYWQGFRGQKELSKIVGVIERKDLLQGKRWIDDAKLSTLAIREAGNMTTQLRVTDGEEFFTLSWPGMDTDPENVPTAVLPVFTWLQKTLKPFRDTALDTNEESE